MKYILLALLAAFTVACAGGCPWSENTAPPAQVESRPTAFPPANPTRVCDDRTAVVVGYAYVVSNPYNQLARPETVERFVRENAAAFSPGSSFAQCALASGHRLVSRAIGSFSATDADRAYSSALSMGATGEQANKVRDSINSDSVQLGAVGEELVWLSAALPAAAAGDWSHFNKCETPLRRAFCQVWPLYREAVALDPSSSQALDQFMILFQDWMAYEIAFLVTQG